MFAKQDPSPRTEAALRHLRRLRPLDGYAVECYLASNGRNQERSDSRRGIDDIVHDRTSGHVVGIRVYTSTGEVGRGVVLVDEHGRIRGDDASTVTVRMNDVPSTATAGTSSIPSSISSSGKRRDGDGGSTSSSSSSTADAARRTTRTRSSTGGNDELLVRYGLVANVLVLIGLAVAYVYASSNRPSNNTFDAKRELKRAMRGEHLPVEDRPRNFLERGLNRLAASVTTELATSLGYGVSLTDCLGAATLACVTVPCNGVEYYWIGIFGKWRFLGQRETSRNRND
ncbi:hypothetical protein ACHAXA_007390 [Cyclostephanos tholiformis]|uniref:Uncharacterized protein n=1 Tax=Cyclostephanos tholiformis TaxID=382380 RepID=A0ABD3RE86_9STRA